MLKKQAKLPNIYIICKSEWNSSNLPRWCSITQIWLGVLKFAQMFLILSKFKWSSCILPKWKQSCLKFPKMNKAVWSYPKLNETFHLLQIWVELLRLARVEVCWNLPKLFQFMEAFLTSTKIEWSCPILLKFHWVRWNLPKSLLFHSNLIKALIVHPDISNCTKISIELFYIGEIFSTAFLEATLYFMR